MNEMTLKDFKEMHPIDLDELLVKIYKCTGWKEISDYEAAAKWSPEDKKYRIFFNKIWGWEFDSFIEMKDCLDYINKSLKTINVWS